MTNGRAAQRGEPEVFITLSMQSVCVQSCKAALSSSLGCWRSLTARLWFTESRGKNWAGVMGHCGGDNNQVMDRGRMEFWSPAGCASQTWHLQV